MSQEDTNGRSKVNWNTFFAGAGLCLSIGGAIVYAVISPIRAELDGQRNLVAAQREISDLKVANAVAVMDIKLIEIETQFRASDQSRNVQFANQQRLDALLWEKTFAGSRFPTDAIYYPSISK